MERNLYSSTIPAGLIQLERYKAGEQLVFFNIEDSTRDILKIQTVLDHSDGQFSYLYFGETATKGYRILLKQFNSVGQGTPQFTAELNHLLNFKNSHPNLPKLIGADFKAKCLFFERIQGKTLENELKPISPSLSVVDCLLILRDLGRALDFLHYNRVVHMDLHPSNIMIERIGDREITRAVLIDFGQSQFFEDLNFGNEHNNAVLRDKFKDLYANGVNHLKEAQAYVDILHLCFQRAPENSIPKQLADYLTQTNADSLTIPNLLHVIEQEYERATNQSWKLANSNIDQLMTSMMSKKETFADRRRCFRVLCNTNADYKTVMTLGAKILSKYEDFGYEGPQFAVDYLSSLFKDRRKFETFAMEIANDFVRTVSAQQPGMKAVLEGEGVSLLFLAIQKGSWTAALAYNLVHKPWLMALAKYYVDSKYYQEVKNMEVRKYLFALEHKYFALSQSMAIMVVNAFQNDQTTLLENFSLMCNFLVTLFRNEMQADNPTSYERLTIVNFISQMHYIMTTRGVELPDQYMYLDEIYIPALGHPALATAAAHALGVLKPLNKLPATRLLQILWDASNDTSSQLKVRIEALISFKRLLHKYRPEDQAILTNVTKDRVSALTFALAEGILRQSNHFQLYDLLRLLSTDVNIILEANHRIKALVHTYGGELDVMIERCVKNKDAVM